MIISVLDDYLFRSSWLACFFLSRNIICSGITLNAQHCPGISLLEWQLLAKLDSSKWNEEKKVETEEGVEELTPTIICDNWNEYFGAISFFSFKVALKKRSM